MRSLILITLLTAITACTPYIQTTSGADYILASGPGMIDADIAEIAAVEPNLKFPARIGVARIVNGHLTLPPQAEVDLFLSINGPNANYGDFVSISPLIMALVSDTSQSRPRLGSGSAAIIRNLRRAAARQHLDYVIVYELGARSRTQNTPLALADITLLGGMLLPTRDIKVMGLGTAALIDVRNGYPYGTTQVTADLSGFARTFQSNRRSQELRAQATAQVAAALIPEIDEMLDMLAKQN